MNPSSEKTLYEKYGGEETVNKIVERLYDIMLPDDKVKHFFEGVDTVKLKKHQANFVSKALGGPVTQGSRSLREAHGPMNLQDEHFDFFVESLTDVLDEVGFEEADITYVVTGMEHARDEVLNR